MNQTIIRIGHSAYRGINSLRVCFGKAQAIRVLRMRGATRDEARKAVNEVCTREDGYRTMTVNHNTVEVSNEAWYVGRGYYSDVNKLKKYWGDQPEL